MSREVVILTRCDTCREPASQAFVVGISTSETTPELRLIDVCDVHAQALAELAQAWTELAAWGPQGARQNGKRTRTRADPSDPSVLTCELCGDLLKTSTSLTNHIWSQHVRTPRAASGLICPDCGRTFLAASATGVHRSKTHGWDQAAEAYEQARKVSK